uniref:Uncharacterized protein n=1 Tax=Setaria viridis TaxID=4556 RepID=A0A4U6W051_SETVI|nr:hypothetical protein SEVIR_2G329266v2 [Setaria viridis]
MALVWPTVARSVRCCPLLVAACVWLLPECD